MLKVGDKFWEYDKHSNNGYSRFAHSEIHVKYFYKHYKDFTFYTKEEMDKTLEERGIIRMIGTRVYNETWGFGEVLGETETTVFVRFDADPWGIHEIKKEVLL